MKAYRYKASISGHDCEHLYEAFTTWLFGGVMFMGLLYLLLPRVEVDDTFTAVLWAFPIGAMVGFTLKLVAQHVNTFGLALSILFGACALIGVGALWLKGYRSDLLCWLIYSSLAAILAAKEYLRIENAAT